MSRHTMATEICLTNGVPIETVSSILGHKNIKTTQIYAKITKEKLNKDMDKLSLQLNHIDEYMGTEKVIISKKSKLTEYGKAGDNNTGGMRHLRSPSW